MNSRLHLSARARRSLTFDPAEPAGRQTAAQLADELEEDACAFVLSFGPRVELLYPPRLRREVADRLRQAAALYA